MSFDPEQYLTELAQIREAAQQRAYIGEHPISPTPGFIERLSNKTREMCPRDPAIADALAETGLFLAASMESLPAKGYACRAKAHVLYTMRKCAEAQPYFQRAVEFFEQARLEGEVGRTLVAQMDNMSYLSLYEEAIHLEPRARDALEKSHDTRYLSTLEIALGNFYYRLGRYPESLRHYDRARELADDPIHVAAIGMGRAHTLTDLNRFDEALQCFESTREFCQQNGLQLWADIADHGISRMHFLRGNYSTALRLIEQVRRKHEETHDTRRVALCDRDRAEIYLQLNLFDDASRLAASACDLFRSLDNQHETAMCRMFQGIAEFNLMHDPDAEAAFLEARLIFESEHNETWMAMVDMWRSQLLIRQHRFTEAQEVATEASRVFGRQHLPVRSANARVLSAQSWHELANTEFAMQEAEKALEELKGYHAPWVAYHCNNTLGRLKELGGAIDEAEQLYLTAIQELESLRGNIRLDELRMSFGKDKYQVYENIVHLKLGRAQDAEAFEFVERSKSRTLIDLLERNLDTVWDAHSEESPRLQRIRKIREELSILYSRMDEISLPSRGSEADKGTQNEIARRERELVDLLREAGTERKSGWETLQTMQTADVADVQAMLQGDEVLVEYYAINGQYQAFLIDHGGLRVFRDLGSTSTVRAALKGLSFQLSKFHLQPAYLSTHAPALLKAIQFHLSELHRALIRPFADHVAGRPLVVVPHQALHYIPFHALYDGSAYLIDNHDISYAPSASVLKICRNRQVPTRDEDLVLAVADELTPYINEEIDALRSLLPHARFFVGAEAREDKLREFGPAAGKLHIAAHGVFRSDNPMFSSLKLGDSWLNLFDIFNLQLGAELTVLSACETGMSAVFEGDELLGLARGFLYAGTPSLVVSLWTVNDRSTARLMRRFYEGLQQGMSKPRALREAMIEVKRGFPHPYFWAPFVLMGRS